MLITIIVFIIILSLLVFVHELGHFWTARRLGVKAEEFGFGLPPRIVGIRRLSRSQWQKIGQKENVAVEVSEEILDNATKIVTETITNTVEEVEVKGVKKKWQVVWGGGEAEPWSPTIYSLNWIPVGGFVKIKGEGGEHEESQDSFASKSVWKKIIILTAGVLMNVILCVGLLSIGFGVGMPSAVSDGQSDKGQVISQSNLQIIQVLPDSPAQASGVRAGDMLVAIDGQEFKNIDGLHNYLQSKIDQTVKIDLKRGREDVVKNIEVKKYGDNVGIGVALAETAIVRYPWHLAIWQGIKTTYAWLIMIVFGFAVLLKNLIIHQPLGVEVAGPVGIAALTGQMTRMGFIYVLQFTALLSLNLAIINILPFPALDGGRILFLLVGKIRRKNIKQQWENLAHNIGFILLMVLIVFITYRDIAKYGSRILGVLKGLVGL